MFTMFTILEKHENIIFCEFLIRNQSIGQLKLFFSPGDSAVKSGMNLR